MKELSDKEVLQKAIEIAMANNGTFQYIRLVDSNLEYLSESRGYLINNYFVVSFNFPEFKKPHIVEKETLIFSHDFAKAFWENDEHYLDRYGWCDECRETNSLGNYCVNSWQYHLQRMVLEENPIDYLRKFI